MRQKRDAGFGFTESQNRERARESEVNGESHQILPLFNMVPFMKTIKRNEIYIFPAAEFWVFQIVFSKIVLNSFGPYHYNFAGFFLCMSDNTVMLDLAYSPAPGIMISRMASPGTVISHPSRRMEPDCLTV